MNNVHKPIGVCIAQSHTMLKTELVSELDRAAREKGCGIIAFNSSRDFYWSRNEDHITTCIYHMIRFEELSALVIPDEMLSDRQLTEYLVKSARQQNIPVFCLGGTLEDCVSILDDYEDAYKSLVRHLIRDHGIRDFFYIAGLRDEENSMRRLACFREVLQEYGLVCPQENIAYGNYMNTAAVDILREVMEQRECLPRAILCANDSMAAAVCDELKKRGYRVPEDVIVTGFDGTPIVYLGSPQLTTCNANPEGLADLILELTDRFYRGERLEKCYSHSYKTILMESCGCGHFQHPRYNAMHTFSQAENLIAHENDLYYSMEQLLELSDRLDVFRKLSAVLLPGSALYINRGLLEAGPEEEYRSDRIEDELIMIPYRKPDHKLIFRKVYKKDMPLPEPELQGTHILNVIHSDTMVFGYYAAFTSDLVADAQLIKRTADVMNMYFCVLEARTRSEQLKARLQDNLYLDPRTGLSNLKGLARWFDRYAADPENHKKPIAMFVCSITRYSWIFETYGMEETENVVRGLTETLRASGLNALIIARINEEQFAAAYCVEDQSSMDREERDFHRRAEEKNIRSGGEYSPDISSGYTMLEKGWESTSAENLIRLALGEMYLNRLRTGTEKNDMEDTPESVLYSSLNRLLENDLIRYYYQPIVDARTGQIFAYEALMRSGGGINLDPVQILSAARKYNRLYDVERTTLFGIIGQYVEQNRDFNGCKVFINTIPGYFLTEADCRELTKRYGNFLDCFVMELTEYDPTTDEELDRIKRLNRPENKTQIAVDDYGTGHNNIVNLLRYAPQIIKIDRALISGIDREPNKQLFVRNTIEFAHQNNIRTLAEGVETFDELRTVIEFGIDLIQGYYTGRPAARPVPVIGEKIRDEIVQLRLQVVQFDSAPLAYTMTDGETADLFRLRLQQINCVRMGSGTYTLTGDPSRSVDMILRIEDDSEAVITCDGISIRGVTEPTVVLGHNSRVTLILKGENTFRKEGIIVPPDSTLIVRGGGNLHINNNRNYSAGIGARYNDPFGTIILELEGKISFSSAGDRVVCIGGGRSAGEGIHLVSGSFEMTASGINVVCLGSSLGDSLIRIGEVELQVHGEGNEVLLIGSASGKTEIFSSGDLQLSAACERAAGIGTLSGTAETILQGGSASVSVNCDSGSAIGAFSGNFRTTLRNARVRIHGEGNQLAGFGSLTGAGETRIESGDIRCDLLAAERMILGNDQSRCVVTGGNFHFSEEGVRPVSPDGTPLYFHTPKEDHYECAFRDSREEWTYSADRDPGGTLGVYIPQKPDSPGES